MEREGENRSGRNCGNIWTEGNWISQLGRSIKMSSPAPEEVRRTTRGGWNWVRVREGERNRWLGYSRCTWTCSEGQPISYANILESQNSLFLISWQAVYVWPSSILGRGWEIGKEPQLVCVKLENQRTCLRLRLFEHFSESSLIFDCSAFILWYLLTLKKGSNLIVIN